MENYISRASNNKSISIRFPRCVLSLPAPTWSFHVIWIYYCLIVWFSANKQRLLLMLQVMNIFWSFLNVGKINDKSWLLYGHKNVQNDTINMDNLTVTSPNEAFDGTSYFAVFCRAISWRMLIVSWSTPPNPNVNMTTELLSSRFLSLMVWNIALFSSEGAPSVRNSITLRTCLFVFSDAVSFRSWKAFSKANL